MITKQTKIVGAVSGLIFVVVLALLSGLIYLISEKKDTFVEKQTESAKIKLHKEDLDSLVRLTESSQEEREVLSSFILSDDQVIDFLALLETLSEEQGVDLELLSIDEVLEGSFGELSIKIGTEGSYAPLLHTLKLLESLPYQAFVESVDISKSSSEGTADEWDGNFVLRVSKFKES